MQKQGKKLAEWAIARLKILSQNRKSLQDTRIKQTIEKVLDEDGTLTESICSIFVSKLLQ